MIVFLCNSFGDKKEICRQGFEIFVCLLLVFFLSTNNVLADSSKIGAVQWLEKMSLAMNTLNYQGTVAFVKNGQLDTMQYFHVVEKELEQERLLALNSPIREVIREAGKVRCIFKESNNIFVDQRPVSKSFIIDLPVDFSLLSDVYSFSNEEDAIVALHPVHVVSVESKDKFRYGRKIWIDKQYNLPLKVEVYDFSGKAIEQVIFADLRVGKHLSFVDITEQIENIKIEKINQLKTVLIDEAGVVLENIPAGFKIVSFTQMNSKNSENSIDHLLLSDGFSSVSLYHEPDVKSVQQGLQVIGTVNLFTHFTEGHQITVMGEVPAKTVQFIAEGTRLRQEHEFAGK